MPPRIRATHSTAGPEATDWGEIVGLYDVLQGLWPTPVVRLNRAVAVGFRNGPAVGLEALAPLLDDPSIATYPYVSAVRADLLRRLGAWDEAAVAYEEAITLTENEVERAFLQARLAETQGHNRA